MTGSLDKAVRRVAVALALALAAGGVLSVGDGAARVLGAVAGYADFGYVPVKCGASGKRTQTLDGGTIRVCNTDYSNTYAFFSGHKGYPLWYSEVELTLQLPDQNLSYWCCGRGGQYPGFADATLDPVTVGNPLTGVSHTAAGGYATIAKTATLAQGASGYTLTYSITNTSGAPLRMRPLATLPSYGYRTPQLATSAGPRVIVMRDPDLGGALSFGESTADGAEAIAGFTAGDWQRVGAAEAPSAPALDNQLHPEDEAGGVAALAWPLTTVAANATRRLSVTVALAQPREVLLRLSGAAPAADAPVAIDASVTDERPDGQLVWDAGSARGTVPVDAAGHAAFTLPAARGARSLHAFYDANRNAVVDDNEPSASGRFWAPGDPGPQPAPPTRPGLPVNPVTVPPAAPPRGGPVPVTALKLPFKTTFRVKRCRGTVTLQLKLGKKVLARRSAKLDKHCRLSTTFTVSPAVIGKGKTLTVVVKQGRKRKSFSLKAPGVR